MRNLNDVAYECLAELDSIGIDYGDIVEFAVNNRAMMRWGQCRRKNGLYYININADLLRDDSDIDGLKNTLIHEILHTCRGCMNHGKEWNRLARIVYRELGYDIKRTSSAEEVGLSSESIKRRNDRLAEKRSKGIKYKAVCNGCGSTGYYQRMTHFIKYPDCYKCSKCGGKFKVEGINGNVLLRAS